MGKILGSWSGMRKYLEREMMAKSLQGRIRYNCTAYVGMDGAHVFEIYTDDTLLKRFSFETVNSYFIKMGYTEKKSPMSIPDYWRGFWSVLDEYPIEKRTEYTDEEFCSALYEYRNQSIRDSVCSENPIVLMFAVLDKRVGRRTLNKMSDEIKAQPEWVQYLYRLRCKESAD